MQQGETTRIVIEGARVLGHGGDPHQPEIADILVEGATIAAIGPDLWYGLSREVRDGATLIDGTGKLATPGFVNAHYHSHDIFLKGYFEPRPLEYWVLNALPRNYPPRSPAEIRARTLLGVAECLRGGITTVQDMVTLFPMDEGQVAAVAGAYAESGIRAVVGLQVADVGPLDTVPYWRETIPPDLLPLLGGAPPAHAAASAPPDLIARVEAEIVRRAGAHPLVSWALAPSSPERCSPAMLERIADLARRHALPVFTHIYISKAEALNARRGYAAQGGSLVRLLRDAGLLGPRTSLAHGVWLLDDEIELLAETGTNVVLNIVSNLKNKNGVAPIRRLIEAGVNIALGCDNCSCTDAQNMFQAMKMLCLMAAVSDPAPGPPDALAALGAATVGGARALGMEGRTGVLAPGAQADIVLLDLADPCFVPLNSAPRQLVYAESGRSVETVIVAGRVVMRDRVLTTIDEAALRAEVEAVMPGFRRDAAAVIARNERLYPHILEADRRTWAQDVGAHRYVGR